MANIKSAQKRVRQTKKRTMRNRARKERLKKAIKTFSTALESKDNSAINEELKKASRAIDKAGSKGIMHKNTVARRKSRMARAAAKASA
jgi:small subunit ribosomal protein S20